MSFTRILSGLGFRPKVNNSEAKKRLYDSSFPEFKEFEDYLNNIYYLMKSLHDQSTDVATGKTISIIMETCNQKFAAVANCENDLSIQQRQAVQQFHKEINEINDIVIARIPYAMYADSITHNLAEINKNMKLIFRGDQEILAPTLEVKSEVEVSKVNHGVEGRPR